MGKFVMVQENGRTTIGAPDKLFGVSSLAKARIAEIGKEKVFDSTIGALMDDEGELIVLSSVVDVLKSLAPKDYAAYAPISGVPAYLEAVKTAVFEDIETKGFVEACYAPGGTGALRNAISCYTQMGDSILTSDWHWGPYKVICAEQQRKVTTYTLFDEEGKFNQASFAEKLNGLLEVQDQVLMIINTPAHNPTGYTFTLEDWDKVNEVLLSVSPEKNIILVVDIAYLDFAGDAMEYRQFMKKLMDYPENILPMYAFSASKGFTMYGMRCGALVCVAPTAEIAKEFKDATSVASRASWSNGNRAAMETIARIFNDAELKNKVTAERKEYVDMLRRRGAAFTEAADKVGLKSCPFDSGFFITIPFESADFAEAVGKELQKSEVFAVVLGAGVRVSIASLSEEKCKKVPELIIKAMEAVRG